MVIEECEVNFICSYECRQHGVYMWPFPLSQNVTLESKQKELYLDTKTDFISSSIQDYKL